jgi:hypothetical protein
MYILSSIAVGLFAESNPENKNEKERRLEDDLGLLAESLVIYFSSFETTPETAELGFNLIYSLPHLGVHGLVEEQYKDLKTQARRIDTVESGNWPLLLRAMTIPSSDKVYSMRTGHQVSLAASVIGKKVEESLRMIAMYPGL